MENIRTGTSLNFTFRVLTCCGLWMPTSYAGTYKAVLYRIFSRFIYVGTLIGFLVTESCDIYLNLGDMEKTIETCVLGITLVSASVKAMRIITGHQRIQWIMDKLDEPTFTRVSKANSIFLLKSMMINNRGGKILMCCAFGTVSLWAIIPYFGNPDEVELPLRAWFPWDRSVRSTFAMLYIYQVISIAIIAAINVSQVVLISSIVMLICGQLDVLHSVMSAIGTDDKKSGMHKDEMNNATGDELDGGVSEADDIKLQLRRCILHQKDILNYVEEVESLFSWVIFTQFFGSCIVFCVTGFQLSVTPFSLKFISSVFYMCTMLVELFLFCYPGNELMIKSARLSDACYGNSWFQQDLAFRKMLIIVMERCKRPIIITAGRIMPLTLSTLTSILRSSYTYYAVLHTMHDE